MTFTEQAFFVFSKIIFRKKRPNPFFAENFFNRFTQFLQFFLSAHAKFSQQQPA
jgi:hypothetical protein